MKLRKNYNGIRNYLSIFIVWFSVLLIFTPDIESLERLKYLNTFIMLGFLALSMILLILNEKRLMFAFLISCGMLCIFLKSVSNKNFVLPTENNLPKLDVLHINLSNFQGLPDSLFSIIAHTNADIVAFQEYTPLWDNSIANNLSKAYEYFSKDVRIDPYGMCIYSRFPIRNASLFYHNEIPNFKSEVLLNDQVKFSLFYSYVLPPFQQNANKQTNDHLKKISNSVNSSNIPKIVIGDFNMVYWSDEVIQFRNDTGLKNSRRTSNFSLNANAFDHIFYSKNLECIHFKDIMDSSGDITGILGSYQMKDNQIKKVKHF